MNATDEGSGDFLASLSLEISHTGTDAVGYSVGIGSAAFSPDGMFLVVGTTPGVDSMYV